MIEITAAQASQMVGRCEYHGWDLLLRNINDHDDHIGVESLLDAWICPGWVLDPDVQRSHHEYTELCSSRRRPIPDFRERMDRNLAELKALEDRCQDSWVLTVPDA